MSLGENKKRIYEYFDPTTFNATKIFKASLQNDINIIFIMLKIKVKRYMLFFSLKLTQDLFLV